MESKEWTRREFVRVAAMAASLFALPRCASSSGGPVCGDTTRAQGSAALPSLGGAPDTHEGRTIAAFVDTIVPGAHRDPTCAPGGLDVNAAKLFFDDALPAAGLIGPIVLLLDGVSASRFSGRQFVDLVPSERETAVVAAIESVDAMQLAVQLAKLAWLSSPELGAHLGYPGPNGGYYRDPHFTFGKPMSRELTRDGNYDSRA